MIHDVKKVLAPVDFSAQSMDGMRGALELANDVGAELHVAHVVAPYFTIVEQTREQARETHLLQEAEEELARIKKDELKGAKQVFTYADVGPVVQKLCEYATQQAIDLIVIATHGRTGSEFLQLGSVTEKLVRTAPCSVLVIRRPQS